MNRILLFSAFLVLSATVPSVAGVAAAVAMLAFCGGAMATLLGVRSPAERLFGIFLGAVGLCIVSQMVRGAALGAWEDPWLRLGMYALGAGCVGVGGLLLAVRLWAAGGAARAQAAPVRRARLAERASVVDPAPPRRSVPQGNSRDELGLFGEDRRG